LCLGNYPAVWTSVDYVSIPNWFSNACNVDINIWCVPGHLRSLQWRLSYIPPISNTTTNGLANCWSDDRHITCITGPIATKRLSYVRITRHRRPYQWRTSQIVLISVDNTAASKTVEAITALTPSVAHSVHPMGTGALSLQG
jgi:hypothetical protein